MTTPTDPNDRLYTLLPAIYRIRDNAQGEPLRALLQVISEQVGVVEADIAQLYANWFIETCDEWVVPYIADLIGYRPVAEAGLVPAGADADDLRRSAVLVPRREVANTIRYRRRKGALALLELLARDVANWPARAVEFYPLLLYAQHLAALNPARGRMLDLRDMAGLERLNGAFDQAAHSVDLRPIRAEQTPGRYHLPNVGLFIWRLKPYSVTRAPAFCIDRVKNRYTFSILGNDTPLLTRPIAEPSPDHIADPLNVPMPISRRALADGGIAYYGQGKSLQIWRDSLDQPIPFEDIVVTDLSNWGYEPDANQVAVDPVRGRMAFAQGSSPRSGVWVSYHYAFSADIGAGEYAREARSAAAFTVAEDRAPPEPNEPVPPLLLRVGAGGAFDTITRALSRWQEWRPDDAIIEIQDSGEYSERISIELAPGQRLELRAAVGTRPVIRLLDFAANRPDAMRIEATYVDESALPLPRFTLDGILVMGRSIQISGPIGAIRIKHSTLVPGWSLDQECEPQAENEPSLELNNVLGPVQIERSILGTILVRQDEVKTDPVPLAISDSILDATAPDLLVLGARGRAAAHAIVTIHRVTVIGAFQPHAISLAENSIFDGLVRVARTQQGCMRFCYVTPGSRTPRRYNCQPDLAIRAARDEAERNLRATAAFAALSPAEQNAALDTAAQRARAEAEARVRPQFTSRRYGRPGYMQLGPYCPPEIVRGADDESEQGAFHHLYQPQRAANLLARLLEYVPAGMEPGFITES
jgi:hypothetical protein